MQRVGLYTQIPQDLRDRLNAFAEANDIPAYRVVERLIEDFLLHHGVAATERSGRRKRNRRNWNRGWRR